MTSNKEYISLTKIFETSEWKESEAVLPIVLGKDSNGETIITDLIKMPHILLGGTSNSGKTNCVHNIIISLLYKFKAEDLRFIVHDPKGVLSIYDKLPHMLAPVITDVNKVSAALNWLVNEMVRRYNMFLKENVRNIRDPNTKILRNKNSDSVLKGKDIDEQDIQKTKMPYIVCIIDELADSMSFSKTEIERCILRLTQLARATGIHVIICTNKPNKNVITSMMKNNLPTRISFKVASQTESKYILDDKGAKKLSNTGEMLLLNNGTMKLIHAQSAHMSNSEINTVIETLNAKETPIYCKELLDAIQLE